MGAVYQAKDIKRQGAVCAIKEMSLSMVPPAQRAQATQNFKIEAKILWGLNHPNLPAFTGFFSENQRYFLVMEYIDGLTLEELLERNNTPFSERRVLGWARQLCDVLEYMHSLTPPIIFRDMKPGNIMLNRSGHIKLIDFGIARFFRPTGVQDTQQLGTPGFAPPEQYGSAQTDERSDIYSLGMTLFQLLTNTLPENGFGLKDIRSLHPQISPVVARALEKATAIDPDDRYNSVAEFRAALLGIGFVFDNGDLATTPQELADLCARYPDEASDYLAAGEIEAWLSEINEPKLAREAQRIRTQISDPMEAVERFLQVVMGRNAQIRTKKSPSSPQQQTSTYETKRSPTHWFQGKTSSPIHVSPRTLDFGQVYPGISAPLALTISGEQGLHVSGTVYSSDSWIMLDKSQFDGMSTHINVRINSSKLFRDQQYTGTVIIAPDIDEAKKDIVVSVEVYVIGESSQSAWQSWQRRPGKTISADMDEDEQDEVAITIGSTMASQVQRPSPREAEALSSVHQRDSEYKRKYGQPGQHIDNPGWELLPGTPKQHFRMQQGLTFSAAFMLSSLTYMLLTQLPFSLHAAPLPPNPWFIFVLICFIPASSIGALLAHRHSNAAVGSWPNRFTTGMACSLLFLSLIHFLWQSLHLAQLPPLQLLVMLVISALSAVAGTYPTISTRMIRFLKQMKVHLQFMLVIFLGIIGAVLGYFLAIGLATNVLFTLFSMFISIVIVEMLVWRTNHQTTSKQP